MTPVVGFYDLLLQRRGLLIPCVDVTAVCLVAHEEGKQNPAEERASCRDAALGWSDSCSLELLIRRLAQTKGFIARSPLRTFHTWAQLLFEFCANMFKKKE